MKYIHISLLLLLLPLALFSNLLLQATPVFGTTATVKNTNTRSWRINSITEESYFNGTWGTAHQYGYDYSAQYPTRLDTLKYYSWDDGIQDWSLNAKFVYVYDYTNEYVTHSDVSMQMGGIWYPYMRSNVTYDNQHRLTYVLSELYNPGTQVWSVWSWNQVDFVNSTNYVVWQYQSETDNRIQQWTKMLFTWDAQGRIIGETDVVSADSINWVNLEQFSRTYHAHDTTTGDIFIQNFSKYMPLQNMLEDAIVDDFFGMLSYEMNRYWSGNAWIDTYQSYYTYDTSDNLTQFAEQQWMNNSWNNNMQINYTYDANGNQHQTVKSYNQNGTMTPESRYTFTWGQTTANDDNTSPVYTGLNLSASPNPFGGEVSIKTESKTSHPVQVSIYNTRGQLVRTINAQTNASITWDGKDNLQNQVTPGVYLVKAVTDGVSTSIKTLKLK